MPSNKVRWLTNKIHTFDHVLEISPLVCPGRLCEEMAVASGEAFFSDVKRPDDVDLAAEMGLSVETIKGLDSLARFLHEVRLLFPVNESAKHEKHGAENLTYKHEMLPDNLSLYEARDYIIDDIKLEALQKAKSLSSEFQPRTSNMLRLPKQVQRLLSGLVSSHPVKEEYGVQYPDVIITYGVVDTAKLAAKNPKSRTLFTWHDARSFMILGSQTLEDIGRSIGCSSQDRHTGSFHEDPSVEKAKLASEVYGSSMFFIENTFYNKIAGPDYVDYSQPCIEWIRKGSNCREAVRNPCRAFGVNIEDIKVVNRMDIALNQISFRFGKPYLFVHSGNCEHLVVFKDIRLLHPDDPRDISVYPLLCFLRPFALQTREPCATCRVRHALWMTVSDEMAPMSPCYFCERCFKRLHYDKDGKPLGYFKAYHNLDHAVSSLQKAGYGEGVPQHIPPVAQHFSRDGKNIDEAQWQGINPSFTLGVAEDDELEEQEEPMVKGNPQVGKQEERVLKRMPKSSKQPGPATMLSTPSAPPGKRRSAEPEGMSQARSGCETSSESDSLENDVGDLLGEVEDPDYNPRVSVRKPGAKTEGGDCTASSTQDEMRRLADLWREHTDEKKRKPVARVERRNTRRNLLPQSSSQPPQPVARRRRRVPKKELNPWGSTLCQSPLTTLGLTEDMPLGVAPWVHGILAAAKEEQDTSQKGDEAITVHAVETPQSPQLPSTSADDPRHVQQVCAVASVQHGRSHCGNQQPSAASTHQNDTPAVAGCGQVSAVVGHDNATAISHQRPPLPDITDIKVPTLPPGLPFPSLVTEYALTASTRPPVPLAEANRSGPVRSAAAAKLRSRQAKARCNATGDDKPCDTKPTVARKRETKTTKKGPTPHPALKVQPTSRRRVVSSDSSEQSAASDKLSEGDSSDDSCDEYRPPERTVSCTPARRAKGKALVGMKKILRPPSSSSEDGDYGSEEGPTVNPTASRDMMASHASNAEAHLSNESGSSSELSHGHALSPLGTRGVRNVVSSVSAGKASDACNVCSVVGTASTGNASSTRDVNNVVSQMSMSKTSARRTAHMVVSKASTEKSKPAMDASLRKEQASIPRPPSPPLMSITIPTLPLIPGLNTPLLPPIDQLPMPSRISTGVYSRPPSPPLATMPPALSFNVASPQPIGHHATAKARNSSTSVPARKSTRAAPKKRVWMTKGCKGGMSTPKPRAKRTRRPSHSPDCTDDSMASDLQSSDSDEWQPDDATMTTDDSRQGQSAEATVSDETAAKLAVLSDFGLRRGARLKRYH